MTTRDQEEQDWKIEQMQTDIENKRADTALKAEQLRWEPWKALAAAFAAGIGVMATLAGGLLWLAVHLFNLHLVP